MMNIKKAGLMLIIVGGLLIGCEDEQSPPDIILPLSGTYSLNEMTINVEAISLSDTLLIFSSPQNGVEHIQIPAGTEILSSSLVYTDHDNLPIGGTVILRNDGSAHLEGTLPNNMGTGCQPLVMMAQPSSDGTWSADTTTGVFSIDLVLDALDIDGSFVLSGNQLEVTYIATVNQDERMISSVAYLGENVPVSPVCLPVSTVTERILRLTRN